EFAAGVGPRASEHVRRVLLTLGGGDPGRLTARLISIIAAVVDAIPVDVVVGPWFAGDAALRALAAGSAGAIVLHDRPTCGRSCSRRTSRSPAEGRRRSSWPPPARRRSRSGSPTIRRIR